MEAKTKEEQYIIPENIARDLKNKFGVDYSLSGMRNATHHINYTCKTMEPLHSNMQSIEDVLKWQHDMKKWFSCVKRDGFEMYVQDETMLLQDHVPKRGPWSPGGQKVFQIYFGDHRRRVIYGAISDSHQYFLQEKKIQRLDVSQICQKTVGTKLQNCRCNGCRIPAQNKGS